METSAVKAEAKAEPDNKCLSLEAHFERSVQRPRRNHQMDEMPDDEKAALLNMVTAMVSISPEARPSMEDLQKSEWMVGWGEPALKELHAAEAQE